jgi:phage terminase large subunit-like protein
LTDSLSPAAKLALAPIEERKAFLEKIGPDGRKELLTKWRGFLARPDQLAPDGDWIIWLALAGRGWGKTKTGAEWIREEVDAGRAKSVALVAETYADARQVMVEGDSGLLGCYPEDDPNRPQYLPSQKKLIWPNGAVGLHFDAREPGQLRGPQFDLAWCDELAKWRYARETWDMLMFGLRLGEHPRVMITTTPRPIELIKELIARAARDDGVTVTRGKTSDNSGNLAKSFMKEIHEKYAGTRLGRQELDAEILEDTPGALWTRANLDVHRISEAPELRRVVVAVDPPATSNENSDEAGVVAVGEGTDGQGHVLSDGSFGPATPNEWGRRTFALFDEFSADKIVIETNQGGDMAEDVLRSIRPNAPIKRVHASKGKAARSEPIAALYEQGRISHVGAFPELEDQMTLMTNHGYEGTGSPDRVDALVWACSELFPSLTRPVGQSMPAPAPISGW